MSFIGAISATQIRAARGMLAWSQDNLADAANVSRATVSYAEKGIAVRPGNMEDIQNALESNGVEFLPGDGVRFKIEEHYDFKGANSCDKFIADLVGIIAKTGGDVICYVQVKDFLTKTTGSTRRTNLQRLEEVQKITDVKCLVTDKVDLPLYAPTFQIRVLPDEGGKRAVDFAYGNQYTFAYEDTPTQFAYAPFRKPHLMHSCQDFFLPRWHIAKPFVTPPDSEMRRA